MEVSENKFVNLYVKEPAPGPISKTVSFSVTPELSTIWSSKAVSVKKF